MTGSDNSHFGCGFGSPYRARNHGRRRPASRPPTSPPRIITLPLPLPGYDARCVAPPAPDHHLHAPAPPPRPGGRPRRERGSRAPPAWVRRIGSSICNSCAARCPLPAPISLHSDNALHRLAGPRGLGPASARAVRRAHILRRSRPVARLGRGAPRKSRAPSRVPLRPPRMYVHMRTYTASDTTRHDASHCAHRRAARAPGTLRKLRPLRHASHPDARPATEPATTLEHA
ncbi:hypothetical protein HYPSUDRAFT_201284 [Hypholoma sublateritium FD-334 SS-4]|uniref:Uncharacterized protein n=1 Tax=Hypholoma sublateritium (strain FD-334 SS-4) TaxID=945553 RepID=A0A0D2P4D4_HYPSF|nr:hypothetical protein HYPSUDRAFT_201284 [Hypholoma sublateritium FD-334 SS-4]